MHSWDHFLFGSFAGLIIHWLILAACSGITGGQNRFQVTWTCLEHRIVIFIPHYSLSLAGALFIQPWLHYILDGLTILGEIKG